MTSINPEILIWARQSSGTSLEEAEEKFGRNKISDWEKGFDHPTYNQLKELCDYYRKPIAICFFPEPPEMKNIPTSCRTLPNQMYSIFSRKFIKSIDEARVMQLNLYELNEGKNPSHIKITDFQFNYNNIDIAAKQLRKILNVDLSQQKRIIRLESAFEFWRDCFHEIGIYVFKNAFQDDNVSGFCLYDEEFPIIYINNSFAISRQIFTLFHEIFHIMYKTSGIDIFDDSKLDDYINNSEELIERSCNLFAGKFLVPDEDFNDMIKDKTPTDFTINQLASLYSVSREVILRKFLDRHFISVEEYISRSKTYINDYFRFKKDQKSSGGNYYNTQIAYKGEHYLKLVFNQYYTQRITVTQLSKYMNMKIPSLQTLVTKKGWKNI